MNLEVERIWIEKLDDLRTRDEQHWKPQAHCSDRYDFVQGPIAPLEFLKGGYNIFALQGMHCPKQPSPLQPIHGDGYRICREVDYGS